MSDVHATGEMSVEPPAGYDLVHVPGGRFRMGSDAHYPEEGPARDVEVGDVWIARTTVTNAQYAAFVDATDYVTVAERPLDPADFPGAPVETLVPGSMVFTGTPGPVDLRHLSQWWAWTPGASWRHPFGSATDLDGLDDHPVVHVAADDAEAYAAWAGLELPTEAEWEHAARGGLDGATYTWGDEPERPGERRAQHWFGDFPWRADPGSGSTAPVASYPANGYGLHDMAGNVWEWTADWYVENRFADVAPCCAPRDPRGGTAEESLDTRQPQFRVPRRVVKGGSFLCADSYCLRYRPAARRPQMIDTGMSHIGFRVAWRPTSKVDA
jgi:formylglycine-generating enzyme required for sulfatase activity